MTHRPMFTADTIKGGGSHFQQRDKIRVGRLGNVDVWVDPDRFFAWAVNDAGRYDLYGIDSMRRRKETSDFVDAMWAMLVMRGYA